MALAGRRGAPDDEQVQTDSMKMEIEHRNWCFRVRASLLGAETRRDTWPFVSGSARRNNIPASSGRTNVVWRRGAA